MSFWVELVGDDGTEWFGPENYTHNCNGMANAVLYRDPPERTQPGVAAEVLGIGIPRGERRESWWQVLNGMDGPRGGALLARIVRGLEVDPGRFRAMNPPNGWGDYDSFVDLLRRMSRAVPERPCVWRCSG